MNATRVSYTLESTLASVNKAEQAAGEVAAKSGFDEDECGRIAMAVREATVNAVLHGNRYDPCQARDHLLRNHSRGLDGCGARRR